MNRYVKARSDRLRELVEDIAKVTESDEKCAPGVLEAVVGAEDQTDNANDDKEIDSEKEWWRRRESNPRPKTDRCKRLRV